MISIILLIEIHYILFPHLSQKWESFSHWFNVGILLVCFIVVSQFDARLSFGDHSSVVEDLNFNHLTLYLLGGVCNHITRV